MKKPLTCLEIVTDLQTIHVQYTVSVYSQSGEKQRVYFPGQVEDISRTFYFSRFTCVFHNWKNRSLIFPGSSTMWGTWVSGQEQSAALRIVPGVRWLPSDERDSKQLIASDSWGDRQRRVKGEKRSGGGQKKIEMAFRDPDGTREWGPTVRVPK